MQQHQQPKSNNLPSRTRGTKSILFWGGGCTARAIQTSFNLHVVRGNYYASAQMSPPCKRVPFPWRVSALRTHHVPTRD